MNKLLLAYLKIHKRGITLLATFFGIFTLVFYLYNLPLEPVFYASLLCLLLGVICFGYSFGRFTKRYKTLVNLQEQVTIDVELLPQANGALEEIYQEILKNLVAHQVKLISAADKHEAEREDYYTLWAHQIKTPIAAMSLLLQDQAATNGSELLVELFKIEQYVEMVLQFLRIESPSSDFSFECYQLDAIVRPVIRKYAKMFIQKKVSLTVDKMDLEVLTDAKWLGFVIEQIISNSLKYTPGGSIWIGLEETNKKQHFLVIKDNGFGIAAEDLPRIFDKGFTGYRGRRDHKSTGIGLYLCKLILAKLGHSIQVESTVGEGTIVKLGLARSNFESK